MNRSNRNNCYLKLQLLNLIISSFNSPMDPNDDVFSDANNDSSFVHSSVDHHDSPESSASDSHPLPSPSPATVLRRRRSMPPRPLPRTKSMDVTASLSHEVDDAGTSLQSSENIEIFKEKIKDFPVTRDSNREKALPVPCSSAVAEDGIEESTLTTAASEDAIADSAESAMELVDSSSSPLEFAAGFVIRAILFQIKILYWLIKFPLLFTFYTIMIFVDPFGTWRKGLGIFTWILGRVSYCVFGCIGAPGRVIFKDQKTFWNVAFKCGWGFLWSIYICCILFAIAVSSLVFSGFVMNSLVDKPIQVRKVLNFDYTKQRPVAYVPIISCAGVGDGGVHDSEKDIAASNWVDHRALPANHKVQVTVSLVVPESGYNRNLGVFQVRADYLSSNGKTIASLSQPCMLKFRSEPIRLMATFLKIAPILTGFISETQTLDVKIKGFVEGDTPTSCLRISLEQRAVHLPGAGLPQIYDSSVVIESELPFFKRIIWHWKISTFIWITMIAFMTQLLFVLVCCWPLIIPRMRQRKSSAAAPPRHTGK